MRLSKTLAAVFLLIAFRVDANVSFVLKFTEQGYWYGKANNSSTLIPPEFCYKAYWDLGSKMSPAEVLCFLSGILREDHPAIKKLDVWKYVKCNKLKIPQKDIISLKSDNLVFKSCLEKYEWLFEKIKKFWGVDKNVYIYCFYSRIDEKQPHCGGLCLKNFVYGNDVYAMFLMCDPPLADKRVHLSGHFGPIAHEFSHAMCHAAFGSREKFETVVSKIQSPNAVVASWYIDEALARVIGNGLFEEAISKEKTDLKSTEYNAKGFAPALYDLTKDYFDNSKTIDGAFLEKAVKIFEEVYPDGYKDPNIYLNHVSVIHTDDVTEHEIHSKLSKRTYISSFYYTQFSKLTDGEVDYTKTTSETLMVIFNNKKQLRPLKTILPSFDDNAPISVIHKNKRTYVLIKIDDKHSLEDRIDELFSRNYK